MGRRVSLNDKDMSSPQLDNKLIKKAYKLSGYPLSTTMSDVLEKLIELAQQNNSSGSRK